MSARPATIDSLEFARAKRQFSGEFGANDSDRLVDILDPTFGAVQYSLLGCVENGRPALRLRVSAMLRLQCQRCLEFFVFPLQRETFLPLARNEAELARWEAEDATLDALLADDKQDVQTLVEDEILLSLPVVPRHAEGECGGTVPA
jgi:uncharacterized protein